MLVIRDRAPIWPVRNAVIVRKLASLQYEQWLGVGCLLQLLWVDKNAKPIFAPRSLHLYDISWNPSTCYPIFGIIWKYTCYFRLKGSMLLYSYIAFMDKIPFNRGYIWALNQCYWSRRNGSHGVNTKSFLLELLIFRLF